MSELNLGNKYACAGYKENSNSSVTSKKHKQLFKIFSANLDCPFPFPAYVIWG